MDCGFTKGSKWFRYRAAAIIVENGCALLVGNANEDYFYSVGGGVHVGETAEDAVMREVFEETGVHYEIDRLAVIHENFFNESGGTLNGLDCHEISFYFLMKPRDSQELHSNSYTFGAREEMHWIPINELDRYKAYPLFLKDYLTRKHVGIEHIVTDERSIPHPNQRNKREV
ncbi:MAG: NUDIX hydrolase [Clostridia bacterium]|nr:NUDIX hydrolase [Clostridia bacterium]